MSGTFYIYIIKVFYLVSQLQSMGSVFLERSVKTNLEGPAELSIARSRIH